MNLEEFVKLIEEGGISRIEIHNFLEEITNNFELTKVKILLNDIELCYSEFLDYINDESQLIYLKNNWDIPKRKLEIGKVSSLVTDYHLMRNRTHLGIDFSYCQTINLLKQILINSGITSEVSSLKSIPEELQTPKAIILFNRASDAGLIEKTESGYKWIGGPKYLLAYFTEMASKHLKLRRGKLDKDENQTISWAPFEKYFNTVDIKRAKNDWMKTPAGADGFHPPGKEKIDLLFK